MSLSSGFHTSVDTVRNNLQRAYPKDIKDSIYNAKLVISKLENTPVTKVVADLLRKNEVDAAHEQLVAIASGRISGAPPEPEGLLDALKAEHALKQRTQLDWGKFSFQKLRPDENHPFIKDLNGTMERLKYLKESLGKLVVQVASEKAKEDSAEFKEFLRIGLRLIEKESVTCPFCLTASLTSQRLERIKTICSQSPTAQKQLDEVGRALRDFENDLTLGWKRALGLIPKLPNDEEKLKICALLNKKSFEDVPFLILADDVSSYVEKNSGLKEALLEAIFKSKQALSMEQKAYEAMPDIEEILKQYAEALQSLAEKLNDYTDAYIALDPVIKRVLSSAIDISMLSCLIEALEKWPSVCYLKYLDSVQDKLLEMVQITREHIEGKQKHILGLRDKQIKDWYDLMNPGSGVGYDSIVPGTDALELRGRTFGQMMMAAPNLSTAQLNCVGLAITLACTTRAESPFRFLVIDDPIQSMDDEHSESFKMSVIKKLIEAGFQVVLLTQLDRFAHGVETLYRQTINDLCLYQIRAYLINGPQIEYNGSGIPRFLADIRANKDSPNPDFRKAVPLDMRKFIERFVKELYVSETRGSLPKRYRNVSWGELGTLLKRCRTFDPSDEPILKNTHDFTTPFLHDDHSVGQTVPSPSQLMPHFVALEGIKEKYKKVLGL